MAAELIEAEAQLEELIIRLDSYKRDHRGALESLNSDVSSVLVALHYYSHIVLVAAWLSRRPNRGNFNVS